MPLPVIDPALYEAQLSEKLAAFSDLFEGLALPAPIVFRSKPTHYRLRAEFRIWHRGERLDYVMFAPEAPDTPIPIETFAAGSERINALLRPLRERLQASPTLRHKLFQVEFLTTLSGAALVTLIYHRPLESDWTEAAIQLRAELGIELIGRSRKQKVLLGLDCVEETLTVGARALHYQQIEGSFTQPNGGINQHMLAWAQQRVSALGGDLLELYCGNGNFTVALAGYFKRVLATEIAKSSVRAASFNLKRNGIDNVEMVRMSSDEISTALSGGRQFKRLAHIDINSYQFSTLLVDPPRAGLDATTLALAARFDNILYVSCNATTLRDNIQALGNSHIITASAAFDQFPYTGHLECGVLLQRAKS